MVSIRAHLFYACAQHSLKLFFCIFVFHFVMADSSGIDFDVLNQHAQ